MSYFGVVQMNQAVQEAMTAGRETGFELQAAFSDAGAQPWEMEAMEDEIQQPRPSMAALLQLDQ